MGFPLFPTSPQSRKSLFPSSPSLLAHCLLPKGSPAEITLVAVFLNRHLAPLKYVKTYRGGADPNHGGTLPAPRPLLSSAPEMDLPGGANLPPRLSLFLESLCVAGQHGKKRRKQGLVKRDIPFKGKKSGKISPHSPGVKIVQYGLIPLGGSAQPMPNIAGTPERGGWKGRKYLIIAPSIHPPCHF